MVGVAERVLLVKTRQHDGRVRNEGEGVHSAQTKGGRSRGHAVAVGGAQVRKFARISAGTAGG